MRKVAPEFMARSLMLVEFSDVMNPKGTMFCSDLTRTRKSIPDISGMFQSERISFGCSVRSFSKA
jgi:hypothetical protein